jgi:hypothetical protein
MADYQSTLARFAPLALLAVLVLVLHLAGVPADVLAAYLAIAPALL